MSRCLSGNFREARQGAPARWWWQTTIRSAPGGASARIGPTDARRVGVEPAALMTPRAARVEPADDGVRGAENGIGGAEDRLEGLPRARDACGQGVRDVVVARDGERRHRQPVEQRLRLLELGRPAAVREVAARDHELGLELVTKCHERVVELGRRVGAAVEVGDVDRAGGHGRTRLYTRSMSEQSPEIFDDLYLGLQAGGAMRKQRRGEELTEQEAAALSRWQRLSVWRKGDRDRRLRLRHVRARLHPRRPDLWPPPGDALNAGSHLAASRLSALTRSHESAGPRSG